MIADASSRGFLVTGPIRVNGMYVPLSAPAPVERLRSISDFGLYRRLVFEAAESWDVADSMDDLRQELRQTGFELVAVGGGPGRAYAVLPAAREALLA